MLWLNPSDKQGVRFLLSEVQAGGKWEPEELERAHVKTLQATRIPADEIDPISAAPERPSRLKVTKIAKAIEIFLRPPGLPGIRRLWDDHSEQRLRRLAQPLWIPGTCMDRNPLRERSQRLLASPARIYDPVDGRFLQNEPIPERRIAAHYLYCRNRVPRRVDPTGRWDENGHFYTTYLVAQAAGLPHKDAFALAYFSQVPDEAEGRKRSEDSDPNRTRFSPNP